MTEADFTCPICRGEGMDVMGDSLVCLSCYEQFDIADWMQELIGYASKLKQERDIYVEECKKANQKPGFILVEYELGLKEVVGTLKGLSEIM